MELRLRKKHIPEHLHKFFSPCGYKAKDEVDQGNLLAEALRRDGWYRRSTIIWHKPNPMPESVRDRPTKSHETVFLLTKAARYFYDAEAIREGNQVYTRKAGGYKNHSKQTIGGHEPFRGKGGFADSDITTVGRNRRTVWTIPTSPFPGSHFATFPPKLIEPMILTSPTKCCAACGKGWERVTEHEQGGNETLGRPKRTAGMDSHTSTLSLSGSSDGWSKRGGKRTTLGFRPACDCLFPPWVPTPRQALLETAAAYAARIIPILEEQCQLMAIYESAEPEDTVPAVVLDVFSGAGTTIMVALRHDRNAIGLELSKTYATMARRRIVADSPLFNHTGG